MQLERNVYPEFSKQRIEVIKETNRKLFSGRDYYLHLFWDYLVRLLDHSCKNFGLIGLRQIGKTAFLARFFNIAFHEQGQVLPLYFCFDLRLRNIKGVAYEMMLTFLKQCLAFLLKKPEIAKIESESKFREALKKIKNTFCRQEILQYLDEYKKLIAEENDEKSILDWPLRMIKGLMATFHFHCMVILDEAQEMTRLLNEKGEEQRCDGSLFTIVCDPEIWVILSGSKVSMLTNHMLRHPLANRVGERALPPLEKEEALELIRRAIANWQYEGYPGIEEDVYNLVGGNPFYILSIFDPASRYSEIKNKDKSFRSLEELKEVFDFEIRHKRGAIFTFWNKHFQDNAKQLNGDSSDETYKILKYIAEHHADTIYIKDLAKILKIDLERLMSKLDLLEEADFIMQHKMLGEVSGMPDEVLSLIIPLIEASSPKSTIPMKDAIEEVERSIQARLRPIHQKLSEVKDNVDHLQKRIYQISGKQSLEKGEKAEEQIREKMRKHEGEFASYRYKGDVDSINIPKGKGKRGYQIDAFAILEDEEKQQTTAGKKTQSKPKLRGLAAEVRNRKTRTTVKDAEKFVDALKSLKKQKRLSRIVALYYSTSGFNKNAKSYLMRHKVKVVFLEIVPAKS